MGKQTSSMGSLGFPLCCILVYIKHDYVLMSNTSSREFSELFKTLKIFVCNVKFVLTPFFFDGVFVLDLNFRVLNKCFLL